MSDKIDDGPSAMPDGRIPTLNHRGFTTDFSDPLSEQFIQFAAEIDNEALDLGCAYGVVVKRALEAGSRICACDMDPRHLDVLQESVKTEDRARLRCVVGTVPHLDFAEHAFGAILCSRLLHFLKGEEVELAVLKMFQWLRPGGKVFLVVDTPYSGVLKQSVPEYKRKKAQGYPWPGFVPDHAKYMPHGEKMKFDPKFLNPMDPDILARVCNQVGLQIESNEFMGRVAKLSDADPEGRDHVALIAVKPHS